MSRLNPRTTQPIVGLCGDIGSGKSAAASYLTKAYNFKEYSFAEKLKRLCKDIYQLPHEGAFGTQAQKLEPVPHLGVVPPEVAGMGGEWPARVGLPWCGRWVLEWQGTEGSRTVLESVWLDVVRRDVEDARGRAALAAPNNPFWLDHRAVVSDVRFQNEADVIQDLGGILIRVEQEGQEAHKTGHASDGWHTEAEVDFRAIAPKPGLSILYGELDKIMDRYAVAKR